VCSSSKQHLPKPYRDRPHWLAVARDLEAAARGGDAAEASMALVPALLIEGVACRTTTSIDLRTLDRHPEATVN
jgi:hypothetical protein